MISDKKIMTHSQNRSNGSPAGNANGKKQKKSERRLSERTYKEALRMKVGQTRHFNLVGNVKCEELPSRSMVHPPCLHCAFEMMGKAWCLHSRFCMRPYRPDHRSVFFKSMEDDESMNVTPFYEPRHHKPYDPA